MGNKCIRVKYKSSFHLCYSVPILVAFWFCIQFYFIAKQEKTKGKNIYKKRFEELINKLYLSIQNHILAVETQTLFQTLENT